MTGKCQCRAEFGGEDCSEFIGTDDVLCPNDCSGNGECDLYLGICNCNDGFLENDCSIDIKTAKLCRDDCSK